MRKGKITLLEHKNEIRCLYGLVLAMGDFWDNFQCARMEKDGRIILLDFRHNVYYNVLRKEVFFMTISLRLSDSDSEIIKAYADMHGMTVSSLIRESVLERIENEHDLKVYEEAMAEYRANPVAYDFMDVCKELDLL